MESGTKYDIALMIFFVPCVIFEIRNNINRNVNWYTELTTITYSVEHSLEVVIVYGTVWILHGEAGRYIL